MDRRGLGRARAAARSEAGLAIVEVLVGAVVVGIAAVGIALMFGYGQTFIQAEGETRVAVQLARQRIEQVLASGFGATSGADPREEATPVDLGTISPSELRRPGYQRTTTIASVCPTNFAIAGSDPGCAPAISQIEGKLITVTVRALDPGGNVDANIPPVSLTSVMVLR